MLNVSLCSIFSYLENHTYQQDSTTAYVHTFMYILYQTRIKKSSLVCRWIQPKIFCQRGSKSEDQDQLSRHRNTYHLTQKLWYIWREYDNVKVHTILSSSVCLVFIHFTIFLMSIQYTHFETLDMKQFNLLKAFSRWWKN